MNQNSKKYDDNIDYDFFKLKEVTIVQHAPWQYGLFHASLEGKFVWYPERGSLIYEKSSYGIIKVGEFTDSQKVWEEIQKKLTWTSTSPTV